MYLLSANRNFFAFKRVTTDGCQGCWGWKEQIQLFAEVEILIFGQQEGHFKKIKIQKKNSTDNEVNLVFVERYRWAVMGWPR